MKRVLGLLYAIACYAFFLDTFVYAILFVANLLVPKTIDSGATQRPVIAAVVDALLLSVFAVQHSAMARQGFKKRWTRIVSPYLERSTYVLAASLALALALWQWRPIPVVIWDLRGTAAATILQVSFWVGWGILLLSTFLINHFELFGLKQAWVYFCRGELAETAFRTPALYRMVRHPLYLGFVIAFWSSPVMTAGHLLFSTAMTGYVLLGILFEERDLTRAYGETYLRYKRNVPMLLPFGRRAGDRKVEAVPRDQWN